jgi:ArsR family transcriptional regulator
MDSAELLDLLGNANRRRILRLLAHKPCYVTEISEYLGVSPKAVIDHLTKLEEAGLIESYTDDQRRKYFNIARNLRLEVNVSPYEFGTKSAYPAATVDITSTRYLSIDVETPEESDARELAAELNRLDDIEHELSLAQRWVHGRLADVMEDLTAEFEGEDARLLSDLLSVLASGPATASELSRRVEAPPDVVEEALAELADRGAAVRDDDGWRLPE